MTDMTVASKPAPTLGELINQVRAAAKDGISLDVGFPPDFTNTPFIAIAHKIAAGSIDEFLSVERAAQMTAEQRSKCCRIIERRVAFLVYSLAAPGPQGKAPKGAPMTYGEKAVGLTFNPSGDPAVLAIKKLYADIIDICDDLRILSGQSEKARLLAVAITEAQTAQMWAVKGITFAAGDKE